MAGSLGLESDDIGWDLREMTIRDATMEAGVRDAINVYGGLCCQRDFH